MKIKFTSPVVSEKKPRHVGEVADIADKEATSLVLWGLATRVVDVEKEVESVIQEVDIIQTREPEITNRDPQPKRKKSSLA